MASWTDTQPPTFAPYIQQQPIESMIAVGTEKQRRYDEGVRRIQANIDRVAGLDIMRDVDRNYLESKLNQLGKDLQTVAAGDFSNYQLVSSVSGMASKIGKDKNIISAVSSTAKVRKEMGRMDADREEGTLDPSNEYVFNKTLGEWLNDPNIGTSYNGRYVPHFDIFKFAKETFDEIKPDGKSFDEIFQMGADGKPLVDENGNLKLSTYMTRLEQKGIFPEKVKATISQIFSDPRVAQQLSISGQYMYRGVDSENLKNLVLNQRDSMLSSYDEAIKKQLLDKGTASTSVERERIQKNIDKLKEQKSQVNSVYHNYMVQAYDSPDSVRAALYKDDVSSRYTTMFGQIDTSQKIMDNPAWKAMFDMQKEANINSRWYSELKLRDIHHKDRMALDWAKLQFDKDRESLEELGTVRQFGPGEIPSDLDVFKIFNDRYEESATNLTAATNDLLWDMIFDNDLADVYNNKLNNLKIREGIDDYDAKGLIIAQEAAKEGKSVDEYKTDWLSRAVAQYENMSPAERESNYILADKYDKYKQAEKAFATQKATKERINKAITDENIKIEDKISLLDIKPQSVILKNGKSVYLSSNDIYDIAVYAAGSSSVLSGMDSQQRNKYRLDAGNAKIRLENKGLGDVVEYFDQDVSNFFKPKDPYSTPYSRIQSEKYGYERSGVDWSQILSVADVIRSEDYSDLISKQAEIIKRMYSISPPQSAPVLTGDTETDRRYINEIANFAGMYRSGQNANESSDFKDFNIDVSSPQNNRISANVSMIGNKPNIEIIQYDDKNKRQAGMTITPEQAMRLDIDVYRMFETPEIKNLRNTLIDKGGKTCDGNERDIDTYKSGDYYYRKREMPKMSNTPNYDVKINIKQGSGQFYPFIYVTDGFDETIATLPGHTHLGDLVNALKDQISPSFIDKALKEKNGR